jgi:hypothetical protein
MRSSKAINERGLRFLQRIACGDKDPDAVESEGASRRLDYVCMPRVRWIE